MRASRSMAFCLLFILSILATRAQAPPTKRDPQAVALLQQSLAAMGGGLAGGIRDARVQATVASGDPLSPKVSSTTISTKGPDRIRWEGSSASGTTRIVIDRGHYVGTKGERRPASNSINKRLDHLPALAIAYELARQDVTVEYIGAETLDGKPIEHLRLARVASTGSDMDDILTKNSQFEVFLDPETRLVLKVAFPWVSDVDMRRSLPFEIYYSDYRSAGGLLIPFAQRAVFNGKQVYELKVSSFAANVGLVDSDFSGRQP